MHIMHAQCRNEPGFQLVGVLQCMIILCRMYFMIIVIDVNECEGDTHPCDENADCVNTVGSFNCTCQSSYFGDGFNYCSGVISNS